MFFHSLLQAARPSDTTLLQSYNLHRLPILTSVTFPGWSNPQGLPDATWYTAAQAAIAPDNVVCVNHEAWPITTQTDRQTFATKSATVIRELKRRRPDIKYGFYGYAPLRDYWRAIQPTTSPQYLAYMTDVNDFQELADAVDVFFPSLYFFYTRASSGPTANDKVGTYCIQNIAEAKRLRSIGDTSRPIYPFVWWMKHDGTSWLDADAWQTIIRTCINHANGTVLWGGWLSPWNPNDEWWTFFKSAVNPRCLVHVQGSMSQPNGVQTVYYAASMNEPSMNWSGTVDLDIGGPATALNDTVIAHALSYLSAYGITIPPSAVVTT